MTEKVHDSLNPRGDEDKGSFLEKSFQAFLFGKGLGKETRTNDRLAILGEHFFKLKEKGYQVLREFPTGAFQHSVKRGNQITPTDFVDLVTLNRWGYLSIIELKLDDPRLEVIAQLLDYALFFRCYLDQLLLVIENQKGSTLKPANTKKIMCYVVNNRYHKRFDEVFSFYRAKEKTYDFKLYKVVLGYTTD